MKEEEKLEIAKFRFGIISEFVTGVRFAHGERERLLQEKCSRRYSIPGSVRTTVSRGTISLWIAKYRAAGNQLSGLMPVVRSDSGTWKKLDLSVRMAMRELKMENPKMTLDAIISVLRERYIIGSDERLNRATCYRFLNTLDLVCTSAAGADRRSFEAEWPNAIWQCDVLHGPQVITENGTLRKSYLVAILDDHSRLVTHAEFCLNETAEILKKCLFEAIQKRGIPQKFYVDNGACYRSETLSTTCAWIGTALIHSRPYTPQGRGKIERFFRTVRSEFLDRLPSQPAPVSSLNERFWSWLEIYHNRTHGTTGQTPVQRFTADMASVRPAPANLSDFFREKEMRVVRRDRTVQLDGTFFEVPQGLIGRKVELRFFPGEKDSIEVFLNNDSHGFARQVNVHVNAIVGRDYGSSGRPAKMTGAEGSSGIFEMERIKGGFLFENSSEDTDS